MLGDYENLLKLGFVVVWGLSSLLPPDETGLFWNMWLSFENESFLLVEDFSGRDRPPPPMIKLYELPFILSSFSYNFEKIAKFLNYLLRVHFLVQTKPKLTIKFLKKIRGFTPEASESNNPRLGEAQHRYLQVISGNSSFSIQLASFNFSPTFQIPPNFFPNK